MAKYVLQEMNDVRNTGKRTVYPKMVVERSISPEEFAEMVHKHIRAIDKGVLLAAICGISDTLANLLSQGSNVTIDEIGTFSASLQFVDNKTTEIAEEGDRMLYRKVGIKDVNFKTSPELLHKLKMKTKLERMMTGVKVLKKQLFTPEQRLENALRIIDAKGFITLTEDAKVNNPSRTTASKELKQLTDGLSSPLASQGQASHKIWVRRNEVS